MAGWNGIAARRPICHPPFRAAAPFRSPRLPHGTAMPGCLDGPIPGNPPALPPAVSTMTRDGLAEHTSMLVPAAMIRRAAPCPVRLRYRRPAQAPACFAYRTFRNAPALKQAMAKVGRFFRCERGRKDFPALSTHAVLKRLTICRANPYPPARGLFAPIADIPYASLLVGHSQLPTVTPTSIPAI